MASPELIKENGVGILYLNSPSKRNSLTVQDMLLIRLLLEDQDHSDIAALIITGKGNVFCAGADFAEIVSIKGKKSKGNKSWSNDYFSLTNNIPNIYYENEKLLVFKSSKLSRNFGNKDILFHNNNVISSDNNIK